MTVYKSATWIVRLRWWIIGLWLGIILGCTPFLSHLITPFKTTGFVDEKAPSTKAQKELSKQLGLNADHQIVVLFTSNKLKADSKQFNQQIKKALKPISQLSNDIEIFYPDNNPNQVSNNNHAAYALLKFSNGKKINSSWINSLKEKVKPPPNMTVLFGGNPILIEDVNHQTQLDLFKADMVAAPVALLTLLFAFGSLVAAAIPLILGAGGAIMILTTLYVIGHLMTLSIFTINIALLLGLCLCLDYCLFVISRFRDELTAQSDITKAIAITIKTAGKAVFYSGLAVIASLSALLIFSVNILVSIAIGGIVAVMFAVISAILILPALLSIIGPNVNRYTIRFHYKKNTSKTSMWGTIARIIVNRPLSFFFPVIFFLLLLGYPFLSAQFGVTGFKIFPEHSEKRAFFNAYSKDFGLEELTPIQVSYQVSGNNLFNAKQIEDLYDYVKQIKTLPSVSNVQSIVSLSSSLSKQQYVAMYQNINYINADTKRFLNNTTTENLTVIQVISQYPSGSEQTKKLINNITAIQSAPGVTIALSGKPVSDDEVVAHISSQLPYAIAWVILTSYLILLFLLRSLFLPLKAILMNLLSLCACYGALVLIFQDGHLHQLLNFEPQGMLDISLLVIIFCALFGFSMDYEVFLLSRIKEYYEKTGNNQQSIIFGIEKSSRIITCAALIVIVICGAFLVADVIMVKAFGIGIAVAIAVDAFLVRSLLVPSTMALMKSLNWYLPAWLDKRLP